MNAWKSKAGITFPIILALLLAAISVTPALADDDPPPTETPEATAPLEENSDESQVTEAADAESVDRSQVDESASTTPPETVTVSEILDSAPAQTQIIILDENGEVLPLASEEASEIVQQADPIWCPASVAVPVDDGAGCSPSQTSMTGLISWLTINNPNMAGTIWIENIYDSSAAVGDGLADEFTLDGDDLFNMATFALTIKGGWDGIGTGTVDTTFPSTFVGDSLSIINWKGNITVSDIEIAGASVNPNPTSDAAFAGLYIETEGSVTLNRVDVLSSGGSLRGVQIENNVAGKAGSVTINDGSFLLNNTENLFINSHGIVTLKNVTASDSVSNNGVQIDNSLDGTPSAVTITNGTFENNGTAGGDDGIRITSNGAVTLTDVNANGNGGSGAVIFTMANTAGTAPVTLKGLNTFNGNVTQWGLIIRTNSAIAIKHVVANGNGFTGVHLDATNLDANTLVKPVTISGSAQVNGTVGGDGHGLIILSNGAVTLNNITATNNFGDGVNIDTDTTHSTLAASVTLKGVNNFNNNAGFAGLEVRADGKITVNNTSANDNAGVGVFLTNDAPSSGSNPSITITGFLTAINNDFGLSIGSNGAVTALNLTTIDNEDAGTSIINQASPFFSPVTLNGANIFNNNLNAGLSIYSAGAVTVNNITAMGNGDTNLASAEGFGVYINNAVSAGVQQAVTLKGTSSFNGNMDYGLKIESYGSVTLLNVTATDNGTLDTNADGNGMLITNTGGTLAKPVTLTGFNVFNGNAVHGADIQASGAVLLNNITANDNGKFTLGTFGDGLQVQNAGGASATPVTIKGVSTFNSNDGNGLNILSDGVVSISSITASYNGNIGTNISNTNPSIQSNVMLSRYGVFNDNGQTGLSISSNGSVTTANLTAVGNNEVGVLILTTGLAKTQSVTLNGNNTFNYNDFSGLAVFSDGNIKVNNLNVNYNGTFGAILDNKTNWLANSFAGFGSVTQTGFVNAIGNVSATGLDIVTHGNVTLTGVTANDNGSGPADNGISITADGNATLTCTNTHYNTDNGLILNVGGNLTLKGLIAYFNGDDEDLTVAGTTTRTPCP
jgi:hypothetical protein